MDENTITIPAANEEFKFLHARFGLKLKWSDLFKLALGGIMKMSFCVRIRLIKDKDGKLSDIDTDVFSTTIAVVKDVDLIETKEAIFDYDKLHK